MKDKLLHGRMIRILEEIIAIVSRGGRPDLAGSEALKNVKTPTLFTVGEKDTQAIDIN